MVGWDFKDPGRLFERVAAMSEESIESMMREASVSRYIVLSTCNRFEIYYDGEGKIDSMPFRPQRELDGKSAVKHLFLVSSGLESLSLGENEILGQLKDAYEKALDEARSSNLMSNIFRKAISCGKNVRHRTGISAGRVSIPSYCGQVIYSMFRGNGKRVSIIGTGKMSRDILKYVMEGKPASVTVYGRTDPSNSLVCEQFPDIECRLLPGMGEVLENSDILVFATSSKKPLLYSHDFGHSTGRKSILDVSVPTNVDYAVDTIDGIRVMRLNDIEPVIKENLEWKKTLINDAEKIVEEQTDAMMLKLRELESRHIMAEIYNYAKKVAEEEAEEYRNSLRNGQDPETSLDGLVNSIVNKLLHPQTTAIKDMAKSGEASAFLEALRTYYSRGNNISFSAYSSSEDQEDRRSRRVQIRQSDHKP